MDLAKTTIDYSVCKEAILWSVFQTMPAFKQYRKECR